MSPMSLVMPYYDNPTMLAKQYALWAALPPNLKCHLEVVLVDDGSQRARAVDVPRLEGLPRLSILRHLEDRPWHQHAARNTGASYAQGTWLLLTDMDHMIEADDLSKLMTACEVVGDDARAVFTFNRREPDGRPTLNDRGEPKPHPNSWCLPRGLYWQIGGYDEALCGIYGTDSDFRHRVTALVTPTYLPGVYLTRYSRDWVPDASTTTLQRKEGRRLGQKEAALAAKVKRGVVGPETLTMKWELDYAG